MTTAVEATAVGVATEETAAVGTAAAATVAAAAARTGAVATEARTGTGATDVTVRRYLTSRSQSGEPDPAADPQGAAGFSRRAQTRASSLPEKLRNALCPTSAAR